MNLSTRVGLRYANPTYDYCHPRLDRGSRVFALSFLCEENDPGFPPARE